MALQEQRGGAGHVWRRHRRAGEDGERRAGRRRRRRREHVEARRRDVGLQHVAEVGGAGRREARDDPAAVGGDLLDAARHANRCPAAVRREVCAQPRAGRSESIPPAIGSCTGMPLASPKRLSTRISPDAPAFCARCAFEMNVQVPRSASRIFPPAEPFGSVPRVPLGSVAEPQRCDSTGLPSVPTIERTSTIVWSSVDHAPGSFAPPALCSGTAPRLGGPFTTESAGAKTWLFDVAATEIASGAVPGEPVVPSPKSSRSLPAAITGTTPDSETLCTVSYIASFAGSVCGPPPEKLMTFIPSATADSKACTISGVFAWWPSGVGTAKTR